MNIRKVTPIFVVDAITPATIAFWERTGWTKQVEVPHGDQTGFVIFAGDGREMMLQSRASAGKDLALQGVEPTSALYVDVASLAEARTECLEAGGRILIEERETFYGARETWALDPSGILVGYAELKHP